MLVIEKVEPQRKAVGEGRELRVRAGGRAPTGSGKRGHIRDFCGAEEGKPSSQDATRGDKAGEWRGEGSRDRDAGRRTRREWSGREGVLNLCMAVVVWP